MNSNESKETTLQTQYYSISSEKPHDQQGFLEPSFLDSPRERSRNYNTKGIASNQDSQPNIISISSGQEDEPVPTLEEKPGHYVFRKGETLNNRYRTIRVLGEGTFGKVVEAQHEGHCYAVKVIRPFAKYIENAYIEARIIKDINSKDCNDVYGVVRFVESFKHNQYYCLVFEMLGKTLYDVLKLNCFQGFSMKLAQSIFYQIFRSLRFLHSINYTHTDLKPENVVFEGMVEVNNRLQPASDKIKMIDFGNAVHDKHHHSSVINTRQYRSPEVILGCCKWDQSSDIWSMGCVMIEIVTGKLLFATREDKEHLKMIEFLRGKFPKWMIHRSEKYSSLFRSGAVRLEAEDDWDANRMMKAQSILSLVSEDQEFQDLLFECLEIDPKQRISSAEGMKHPFFNKAY